MSAWHRTSINYSTYSMTLKVCEAMFRYGIVRIPSKGCAVLPARSRPWQARGDAALLGSGPRRSRGHLRRGSRRSQGGRRMSVNFEELDFRPTPMGVLSLRRRRQLIFRPRRLRNQTRRRILDVEPVHRRRDRAGAARAGGAASEPDLDVVVGGLGLGYTAQAVLENPGVRSLVVVDALAEVIEWHEQGLLPLGKQLTDDPRCRLVHGDFFAMSHSADGFDPRRAAPPLRCGAGRYRPLAAQPAASAPCRALRAGGACAGSPRICIPAACSRCGRTTRRMTRFEQRAGRRLRNLGGACRDLRQFVRGSRRQQYRLCRRQGRFAYPEGNGRGGAFSRLIVLRRARLRRARNLPLPIGHAMLTGQK